MTFARPWSLPVAIDQVPETGRRVALSADAHVRAEIAKLAGLRDLPRFEAVFDVTRQGADGLRVVGDVSAIVGQTCVVTLEPLTNEVAEHVDLVFMPPGRAGAGMGGRVSIPAADNDDSPEVLTDGAVDLGAVATEFLLLGLDPYPRKPDVRFDAPLAEKEPSEHPFAALAALKKEKNRP
jgi:uncharacterized metal-binding protein YceD (DUF177 family)